MPSAKRSRRRVDPYRGYSFRVRFDGRIVAGVTKVSALKRTTQVVEYREGGNTGATRKLPGVTGFEPITLERGITHDADFEAWARLVAGSTEPQLAFRKEVRIEVHDAGARLVLAYDVHRCWPSEFVALAGLDDSSSHIFQSLTLQNEGWDRDTSIKSGTSRRLHVNGIGRLPSA